MKSILIIIFLFFTTSPFAQLSLDSLRLVLPSGHIDYVSNIELSPNNKYLISQAEKEFFIWDLVTTKLINYKCTETEIKNIFFTEDSKNIILVLENWIQIIDIYSWKTIRSINRDNLTIKRSFLSLKNNKLYVHTLANQLFALDLSNWHLEEFVIPEVKNIIDFDINNTKGILYIHTKSNIFIYDLETSKLIRVVKIKSKVKYHITFDPQNQYFIVWGETQKGQLSIYSSNDPSLKKNYQLNSITSVR